MYVVMTVICPKSGNLTNLRMMQKSEKKNKEMPMKLITVAYAGDP